MACCDPPFPTGALIHITTRQQAITAAAMTSVVFSPLARDGALDRRQLAAEFHLPAACSFSATGGETAEGALLSGGQEAKLLGSQALESPAQLVMLVCLDLLRLRLLLQEGGFLQADGPESSPSVGLWSVLRSIAITEVMRSVFRSQ